MNGVTPAVAQLICAPLEGEAAVLDAVGVGDHHPTALPHRRTRRPGVGRDIEPSLPLSHRERPQAQAAGRIGDNADAVVLNRHLPPRRGRPPRRRGRRGRRGLPRPRPAAADPSRSCQAGGAQNRPSSHGNRSRFHGFLSTGHPRTRSRVRVPYRCRACPRQGGDRSCPARHSLLPAGVFDPPIERGLRTRRPADPSHAGNAGRLCLCPHGQQTRGRTAGETRSRRNEGWRSARGRDRYRGRYRFPFRRCWAHRRARDDAGTDTDPDPVTRFSRQRETRAGLPAVRGTTNPYLSPYSLESCS